MKKVKPCPFCGSPGQLWLKVGYYKVECTNRECPSHKKFVTKEMAVEEWNRREKKRAIDNETDGHI